MSVAEEEQDSPHPNGWNDSDWEGLMLAIKRQLCTPFLGAGACAGLLPLGRDIAEMWARRYRYPFGDDTDLVRVAQFVAVHEGPMVPKLKLMDLFDECRRPNLSNPDELHRVMADLNLPVYITTNYDDFMARAIAASPTLKGPDGHRVQKVPLREHCRWYLGDQRERELEAPVLEPSREKPLVFHLHGVIEDAQSMVLTEDDYLDFLMNISEQKLIPPRVERAFSQSALLFLGYSLEDMNFKVLFRKLASYMRRNEGARHVSVQLAPRGKKPDLEELERADRQRQYLERHFDLQKVKVYWGKCEDFAKDLRQRWAEFNANRPS
jgi:hypothetical protein